MANASKKGGSRKRPHPGPHGDARKAITRRNKARRALRLQKKHRRLAPAREARRLLHLRSLLDNPKVSVTAKLKIEETLSRT